MVARAAPTGAVPTTTKERSMSERLRKFLELLQENGLFPDCDDIEELNEPEFAEDLKHYEKLLEQIKAL
jgi:hypothetical protein